MKIKAWARSVKPGFLQPDFPKAGQSQLKRWLASTLPGVCVLCEMPGQLSRDLCEHCHEALPWNLQACPSCAEPLAYEPADPDSNYNKCKKCPEDWPICRTVAPLLYSGAARRWVTRLKFQQGLVEGRLLGELLADAAMHAYPIDQRPTILVPIPLHWRRLMQRGMNQAQVLTGPAAKRLQIRANLTRLKRPNRPKNQTKRQHELGRAERLIQLTDSFRSKPWQGQHIALVDDVITTGATASAAARACLEAGANRVDLWCATRTPAPDGY